MPENKPFVINDRRKFTSEGELRQEPGQENSPQVAAEEKRLEPGNTSPDNLRPFEVRSSENIGASSSLENSAQVEPFPTEDGFDQATDEASAEEEGQDELPPPPTPEEIAQASRAYQSTVERLETAMRAANPGGERLPPMSFERFVQSLYMQALLQLGSIPEPGQPAQVDLIGARQTIDMLAILVEKTRGNLSGNEQKLLDSAAFELRMGFLEVTQALARQAATARQQAAGPGSPGGPRISGPGGPSIVR